MKVLSRFYHPTEHRMVQPGEDFDPVPTLRLQYVKNGILEPETDEEVRVAPSGPWRARRKRHGDLLPAEVETKVDEPSKPAKPARKPAAKKGKAK